MRGHRTRVGLSIAALALCAAAAQAGQGEASVQLKDAPGSELTSAYCAVCHSLEYIPANAPAMDRAGWQRTVQKMRERGAQRQRCRAEPGRAPCVQAGAAHTTSTVTLCTRLS